MTVFATLIISTWMNMRIQQEYYAFYHWFERCSAEPSGEQGPSIFPPHITKSECWDLADSSEQEKGEKFLSVVLDWWLYIEFTKDTSKWSASTSQPFISNTQHESVSVLSGIQFPWLSYAAWINHSVIIILNSDTWLIYTKNSVQAITD